MAPPKSTEDDPTAGVITVHLEEILDRESMTMTELAERVGITLANMSILKTGKAKAVRFNTLAAICDILGCQPGDILRFEAGELRANPG